MKNKVLVIIDIHIARFLSKINIKLSGKINIKLSGKLGR